MKSRDPTLKLPDYDLYERGVMGRIKEPIRVCISTGAETSVKLEELTHKLTRSAVIDCLVAGVTELRSIDVTIKRGQAIVQARRQALLKLRLEERKAIAQIPSGELLALAARAAKK